MGIEERAREAGRQGLKIWQGRWAGGVARKEGRKAAE